MNSEINDVWKRFEQTGSVEAYLKYRNANKTDSTITSKATQKNAEAKKGAKAWG